MPSEFEIERMVVRLEGDKEQFESAYEEAAKSTDEVAAKIEKSSVQSEDALDSLANRFKALSNDIDDFAKSQGVSTFAEDLTNNLSTIDPGPADEVLTNLQDKFSSLKQELEDFGKVGEETAQVTTSGYEQVASTFGNVANQLQTLGARMTLIGSTSAGVFKAFALKGWAEEERNVMKLSGAIKANGRDVEKLTADYQEFAAVMQSRTVVGDETVDLLLQQAEAMGLTGEAAKRAAKNALALSAARGIGAQGAIRMMISLEQGHAEILGRFFPVLRDLKDKNEKAAKAQELLSNMFVIAEEEAKSFDGQMRQLKNELGDTGEMFGKIIADQLKPYIHYMREANKWIQQTSDSTKLWLVALGNVVLYAGPTLVTIGELARGVEGLVRGWEVFAMQAPQLAGAFSSIFTASNIAKAGLVALTAVVAYEVTRAFTDPINGIDDFNNALKESGKLASELDSKLSKDRSNKIKSIEGLPGQEQRKEALQQEIEDAKKLVTGYEAMVNGQAKHLAELKSRWISWIPGNKLNQAAAKDLDELKSRGDSAKKYLQDLQLKLKDLGKDQDMAASSKEEDKQHEAILDRVASYQEEFDLLGKTATQKKLYELELQGATDAELAEAEAILKKIDAYKAEEEAKKKASKAEEELRRKAEQYSRQYMTEEQKKAEKKKEADELLAKGLITQEVYQKSLEQTTDKVKAVTAEHQKAKEEIKGLEAGSADAIAAMTKYRENYTDPYSHLGGSAAAMAPMEKPTAPIASFMIPTPPAIQDEKREQMVSNLRSLVELTKQLVAKSGTQLGLVEI